MFAKDKFQFESPNVIDPGDQAPTAPSRGPRSKTKIVSEYDGGDSVVTPPTPERRIINTSMNFRDARDNATTFLKDVEVSPTRGAMDLQQESFHDEEEPFEKYDDYNDIDNEDDDEYQLKVSLTQNSKASRSYAKNVLMKSAPSNSSPSPSPSHRSSLSQPSLQGSNHRLNSNWRRPPRRNRRKLKIPQRYASQQDSASVASETNHSKRLTIFFCLAPLVLIALVLTLVVGIFKNISTNGGETSQSVPDQGEETYVSDRLMQTIDMLNEHQISDRVTLTVPGTPQYLAAKWMADVDPLQYEIPSRNMPWSESYRFVQRYILVLFYYTTGGNASWFNNLDFLSDHHECSWFHSKEFTDGQTYAMGVTCDDELHVSDLLIPANNLTGTLPTELNHLTHLEFLSLSHNKLAGTVPDLSRLSQMKYLDLGTNKLEGEIPNWLGTWSQLKVLGFENNRMTGELPEHLSALTNLITLDLRKNLFKGAIDAISSLVNLEFLYLDQNQFAEYIGVEGFLDSLQVIREIDISNNLFYGNEFPGSLLTRSNLTVLDISGNALRGPMPATIEPNSVLEVLEMHNNGFTGTIPSSIDALVNLRHLDLQMNHFHGKIPDQFVNLRHLTYLSLGENDFIPAPIPAFLSSFTQLKELSLARCNLIGSIPDWFGVLSDLKFVNLQVNELQGTVPRELWDLPNLAVLLLSDNKLNDTVPSKMGNAENLEILTLDNNDISGEVDTLCNGASKLEALTFDCAKVTCNTACCDTCCNAGPGLDTTSCFSRDLMTALGKEKNTWEFKYGSNAYSFSPKILQQGATNAASSANGRSGSSETVKDEEEAYNAMNAGAADGDGDASP